MPAFHHPTPNATGSHDAIVGDPQAIAALIDRARDAAEHCAAYPAETRDPFALVLDESEIEALCDLWLIYEGQVEYTATIADRLRFAQNVAAAHAGNAARWQSSARGWAIIAAIWFAAWLLTLLWK